jgi:hypothetical protein
LLEQEIRIGARAKIHSKKVGKKIKRKIEGSRVRKESRAELKNKMEKAPSSENQGTWG